MKERNIIEALLLFVVICCPLIGQGKNSVREREHPCIYVSSSERAEIQRKVNETSWARDAFSKIRKRVEKYVNRHVDDPEWIVSRLAMYWKDGERYTQCYLKNQNWERGEGNAPVPTVRMPGMRTWNKYVNVPLEQRTPYNETGDMLGLNRQDPSAPPVKVPYKESGHMIRSNNAEILTLAEDASFVYWVTGEEKFARFAADIFNTWLAGTYYMNPILDPEQSCGGPGGWAPGGICGYYDYEQIHDDLAMHAAVVYDFLYDYLKVHPHVHFKEIGKSTQDVAGEVFKRFIEIGFVRGGRDGNWNVNGWNVMIRPVLVLEDDSAYADRKGRNYYLNFLVKESTEFHEAIPGMLKNYDAVTGLWPESPGYSFGTIDMLLDWAMQLKNNGIDIVAGNPILEKAAMAVFPWMDDSANMVVFGDSRGGSANFLTFERLLAYYRQTGNLEGVRKVSVALRKGIVLGKYCRSDVGWPGICTFVAEIPEEADVENERASYSPHHRFITMKNWEHPYKMMACVYGGTKGYHLTPNGLALQLYAYGYALAPDAAAYESYWSKDHAYHQSVTGSNTVLPGYTEGEITINAMEPSVPSGSFVNEKALTSFFNFVDVSAGEKRRTVIMVENTPYSGYYVDVFRSDQNDNDYLFHHVGSSMDLSDAEGNCMKMVAEESFQKKYHGGYDWFTNIRKTDYDGDFVASWTMPEGIKARLWMAGMPSREIYQMDAPATTMNKGLTPGNISMPPAATPTLLVRQEGVNAASHPFVAVYEAYKDNSPSVRHVETLRGDVDCVGLKIETAGSKEDYLFSTSGVRSYAPSGQMSFRGCLGMVRTHRGEVECLYLGNGRMLRAGEISISADVDVYAALYKKDGKWYYSSTGPIRVKLGKKEYNLTNGYDLYVE